MFELVEGGIEVEFINEKKKKKRMCVGNNSALYDNNTVVLCFLYTHEESLWWVGLVKH